MAKRSKSYLNRRSIITRSVLVEKRPFLVLWTPTTTMLDSGEYRVQVSDFNEEYYVIMEGNYSGQLLEKFLCSKIQINE